VEAARVKAEAARVEAENSRVKAESNRVSAENSRAKAETARADAEAKRATAETSRAEAENARRKAETSRAEAENDRTTAETNRDNAESTRQSNETTRKSNETKRQNAETSRADAESKRVEAENERASHEDSRLQSEANANASAEAAAKSESNAAESERVCKEYLEQVKSVTVGAQGYYVNEDALKEAVSVGEDGWWAVIGATDTIWVWDSDTSAWVDSHDMTEFGDYYTRTQTEALVTEAKSVRYTITVPASGWITDAASTVDEVDGDSTTYYNTVEVEGITADTRLCCIELADDYKDNADAGAAYRQWSELDTAMGKVIFYSSVQPTATFVVQAMEVR
jgi:hypothetical protein